MRSISEGEPRAGVLEATYDERSILGPIVVGYIRLGKADTIRAADLPISGGHLRVHPQNTRIVRDFFVAAHPDEVSRRTGLHGVSWKKRWPQPGEDLAETMFSEYLDEVMRPTINNSTDQ